MHRVAASVLLMLALSGCSYEYDVQASVVHGRLMFDANPKWGADCVNEVEVRAEGKGEGTTLEQKIAADRAITAGEGDWLKGHVDADGAVDDYERALLDFVAEESGTRI